MQNACQRPPTTIFYSREFPHEISCQIIRTHKGPSSQSFCREKWKRSVSRKSENASEDSLCFLSTHISFLFKSLLYERAILNYQSLLRQTYRTDLTIIIFALCILLHSCRIENNKAVEFVIFIAIAIVGMIFQLLLFLTSILTCVCVIKNNII